MKKICYFTIWREDSETVGINLKIANQVKAFSHIGCETYYCVSNSTYVKLYKCIDGVLKEIRSQKLSFHAQHCASSSLIKRKFSSLKRLKECLSFVDEMNNVFQFDMFYIRRIVPFTRTIVRYIKKWNEMNCRIVWEIPTWGECNQKSFFKSILSNIENTNYKKLNKMMYIVAISSGQKASNNVFLINNGVNCSDMPPKKCLEHDGINLVCLATFSHWHGYDRLLKGLKNYYDNSPQNEVNLYMIGNGEIEPLIALSKDLNLIEYVHFLGVCTGSKLDSYFDKMDIAIGNLGFFRKGVTSDTSIKIREYCARGIPFVTALMVNDFPENYPYILHVPMDESDVDIKQLVCFYESLNLQKACLEMRKYAENNLSWDIQLQKVLNYVYDEKEEIQC